MSCSVDSAICGPLIYHHGAAFDLALARLLLSDVLCVFLVVCCLLLTTPILMFPVKAFT